MNLAGRNISSCGAGKGKEGTFASCNADFSQDTNGLALADKLTPSTCHTYAQGVVFFIH
jgi:hypothetical protein